MTTRCLLVDDEPLALNVLETYLKSLDGFEIVAACTDAFQALTILQREHIDLMFLDIRMPQLDGVAFLKTLPNPPKVIVTTAYRTYAIEGFDLNVVDYLLKPIPLERFLKAINNYCEMSGNTRNKTPIGLPQDKQSFVYVKVNKKTMKVYLKDICFIESLKDYVIIHKRDTKIITKDRISHFETILPQDFFLRIHRSYIVSIPRIEAVTAETIEIGKKELPIGRSYKTAVIKSLNIKQK
jgi:DNA-binding LytR/AlgR family response regulator